MNTLPNITPKLLLLVSLCLFFNAPCTYQLPKNSKELLLDYYGDTLPKNAVARCGTVRFFHGPLNSLACSPDGNLIASAGEESDILIWDVETGRNRLTFQRENLAPVNLIAFSHNGQLLAVAETSGQILLCNLNKPGLPPRSINGKTKTRISAMVFSPDGKHLALSAPRMPMGAPEDQTNNPSAGFKDKTVRIWDTTTLKQVAEFDIENDLITSLSFAGDTARLIAGSFGGNVWLCNDIRGTKIQKLNTGEGPVRQISCSTDGKIASFLREGLQLLEIDSGKLLKVPTGMGDKISAQCLSSDGRVLVIRNGQAIKVFDLVNGSELKSIPCDNPDLIDVMTISTKANRVAVPWNGFIRLWDITTGSEVVSRPSHMNKVTSTHIQSKTGTLVSSGLDGTVFRWDLLTGRPLTSVALPKRPKSLSDLSQDGAVMAQSTSTDLVLYDTITGRSIKQWKCNASSLKFSCMPNMLAITEEVANENGPFGSSLRNWFIRIIDMGQDFKSLHFPRQTEALQDLAFTLDGKVLASGGFKIRIWDVGAAKLINSFGEVPNRHLFTHGLLPFSPMFFTPSGELVVREVKCDEEKGTFDVVSLWDISTGDRIRVLPYLDGYFSLIGQSSDGRLLAMNDSSPNAYRTVVREWPSFKRLLTLPAGYGSVAEFAKNQRRLIVAGPGGIMLVWDLNDLSKSQEQSPKKLTRSELDELWQKLGHEWSWITEETIDSLVDAPDSTVAYLEQHLKPVPNKNLMKLIADLDSDQYSSRESAMVELLAYEFAAYEPLKSALSKTTSLEAQSRIKRLLIKYSDHFNVWARQWNAIVVLEQIGTPGARRLLEALSQGASDARLTDYARAAIRRMDQKAK